MTFGRVVNCKLAERQRLIPVGLAVIDKGSQGVLHHPVHALCLSISLGVVRCAHPELDTKGCKHFLKEGRREAGISI